MLPELPPFRHLLHSHYPSLTSHQPRPPHPSMPLSFSSAQVYLGSRLHSTKYLRKPCKLYGLLYVEPSQALANWDLVRREGDIFQELERLGIRYDRLSCNR